MLAVFCFSFVCLLAFKVSKNHQHLMKILVKRGKNGSLGVVLEALGVAPGGIWAPKSQNLKKGQKSEFEDPPQGTHMGDQNLS